jgi:hypothetical protein
MTGQISLQINRFFAEAFSSIRKVQMAENPDSDKTDKEDDAKAWVSFPEDVYEATASRLVHHSWKVSNSNAAGGGVRLSASDALRLPYVSARTLLAAGVTLDLDYIADAKNGKIVKQMRAVQRASELSNKAPTSDSKAIKRVLGKVDSAFEDGTDLVDARLRQILLPKSGSYVSVTPITSSGVCAFLFDKDDGLVTRHNKLLSLDGNSDQEGASKSRRRLNRAHLGIGGSNPQNIGALVRSMQRPLFVPGPAGEQSARVAFAIYYKGVELKAPRDLLLQYEAQRTPIIEGRDGGTDLQSRLSEEEWTKAVASWILAQGASAFETLSTHADLLPREAQLESTAAADEFELVSRSVPAAIRGLIDARLKERDWPRSIAKAVMTCLLAERRTVQGEEVAMLVIDGPTRAKIAGLLEEAFQ